jgi:beta-glucanase (GH16 family)
VAAAAATATALLPSPSAQAFINPHGTAPRGNLAGGWTQVFVDDFTKPLNTSQWGRYSGQPGGNPYGMWSPAHVNVDSARQAMRLRGYRVGGRFVTGGVMLNRPQTYGKWLVRAAFNKGAGIEQVMLLWPTQGWPPELDFHEGAADGKTMATAHWGATNQQKHFFKTVEMRRYHVYGLEWTPTSVTFTMDGKPFGRVTGAAVPHQPMSLAIQTHATRAVGAVSAAVPAEVTEYVDWVSVYRYR